MLGFVTVRFGLFFPLLPSRFRIFDSLGSEFEELAHRGHRFVEHLSQFVLLLLPLLLTPHTTPLYAIHLDGRSKAMDFETAPLRRGDQGRRRGDVVREALKLSKQGRDRTLEFLDAGPQSHDRLGAASWQ